MSENQPETPISEPTSAPTATQEPTQPAPIPLSTSEPSAMPPVAPESHTEAERAVPVNNDNSASSPENGQIEQTAQPVEPLNPDPESEPEPSAPVPAPAITRPDSRSLFAKARETIQFRKRKKLEKIMGMFLKQATLTNDQVEKLLHVSDATATRYLDQLEKEGRIKKESAGKYLSYSRM